MKVLLWVGALAATGPWLGPAVGGAQPAPPPPPAVKVGDPAPDFTLTYLEPAKEGARPERKQIRLSDFKGKQNVVLAFFVAAFSPG